MGSTLTPAGQPLPLQPGEFSSSSAPNAVSFGFLNIPPPSPLYVARDDQLFVLMNSNGGTETVRIGARLLLPNGNVVTILSEKPYTSGVRGVQSFTIPLAEGYLLGLVATSASATGRGQTFVRVYVVRGATSIPPTNAVALLVSNYITTTVGATWPGGQLFFPTDGQGWVHALTVNNPAAGAEWTFTNPAFIKRRIQSVSATLVTSAAAGTRLPQISITGTAGARIYQAAATQGIGPSLTATVIFAPVALAPVGNTNLLTVPLALPALTYDGYIVSSLTQGIDAGDQWSAIKIDVEEWFDNL